MIKKQNVEIEGAATTGDQGKPSYCMVSDSGSTVNFYMYRFLLETISLDAININKGDDRKYRLVSFLKISVLKKIHSLFQ